MIIQVNYEQIHGLSMQFHVMLWTVYELKHKDVTHALVCFGIKLVLLRLADKIA